MNDYQITYSFAGGPELTTLKAAPTETKARRALYAQIGRSHLLQIISIRKIEG